jgi:hypothetical protein
MSYLDELLPGRSWFEFNFGLHQGVWYHIYFNLQAKVHGYDLLS